MFTGRNPPPDDFGMPVSKISKTHDEPTVVDASVTFVLAQLLTLPFVSWMLISFVDAPARLSRFVMPDGGVSRL
jgi:hypothetical protein